jgi:hypothetical protein
MKTKLTILTLVMTLATALAAQTAMCAPGQSIFNTGPNNNNALRAAPLSSITICNTFGVPCGSPTPTSQLWADAAETQPLTNPFTADANGNYQWCSTTGVYFEQVTYLATTFVRTITLGGSGSGSMTWPAAPGLVIYAGGFLWGASIAPNAGLVPQILTSSASAYSLAYGGVIPNAQVGTTYTIAASDRAGYLSFSNINPVAVTLPQAATTGFTNNFVFVACDIGAGTATITPTVSTISYSTGSSYTSGAASMPLTTGQCAFIYSDNVNYFAFQIAGAAGASASPNLYTEVTVAGTTTNSNSGAAVNMFTGYTIPASKLTAGHRIVAKACFKHSTGTTGTTYNWAVGSTVAGNIVSSSANVSPICTELNLVAVDNTHQTATVISQTSSTNGPTITFDTYTLTNTNTINVTQTAAGTADVYTAYNLTVDLF